jgi:hypothetical protein
MSFSISCGVRYSRLRRSALAGLSGIVRFLCWCHERELRFSLHFSPPMELMFRKFRSIDPVKSAPHRAVIGAGFECLLRPAQLRSLGRTAWAQHESSVQGARATDGGPASWRRHRSRAAPSTTPGVEAGGTPNFAGSGARKWSRKIFAVSKRPSILSQTTAVSPADLVLILLKRWACGVGCGAPDSVALPQTYATRRNARRLEVCG